MKSFNLKFVTTAIIGLALASSSYGQVGFSGTNNSGTNATALGFETTATGQYSTALGFRSTASGGQSFAAGHWSTASGTYSFGLGARAVAAGNHSMAFGLDVRANSLLSMIIGNGTGNGSANAMHNNIPNSLMIGFNSTIPTVFVGSSSGAGTTGRVGIGTTNTPTTIGSANISAYSLYVKGGILTEELRVRTGWADYVFLDDYKLTPLSEVAEFIEKNGHLPNVPSAAQVEEEGIEMGEITKVQQEKIEELTLYVIELQKQLDQLKTQVSGMEK